MVRFKQLHFRQIVFSYFFAWFLMRLPTQIRAKTWTLPSSHPLKVRKFAKVRIQNQPKKYEKTKIHKKRYFSPTYNCLKCTTMKYRVSSDRSDMRKNSHNFFFTVPKSGKDNIIVWTGFSEVVIWKLMNFLDFPDLLSSCDHSFS